MTRWSDYLFSGIGLGIRIPGLLVLYFEARFVWQGAWIGLGILSILFLAIPLTLWGGLQVEDRTKVITSSNHKMSRGFMPWIIAVALKDTGTFLVDIIHNIPSLQAYSSYWGSITHIHF